MSSAFVKSTMIEFSCSNDDLASTPSNQSEYFSVTSSLNILDSNEEIYHSFDEENEPQITCESIKRFHTKIQVHKIVKQNHLDLEMEEIVPVLSTSVETIPEPATCRNSAECELWDKVSLPLRVVRSQESVNTFEDDVNNSSIYSNSQIKESSINEESHNSSSDNEDSVSLSLNTTNQILSSQLEGELSDINDIIYDSSVSPVAVECKVSCEEIDGSQDNIDVLEELSVKVGEMSDKNDYVVMTIENEIDERQMQIYDLVKQLEQGEIIECEARAEEKPVLSNDVQQEEKGNVIIKSSSKHRTSSIKSEPKKEIVENVEDSPVKRSHLCCGMRRTKKPSNSPKAKSTQKSKAKRLFLSIFKKSSREKKPAKADMIIVAETNNCCNKPPFINAVDYDAIPYIDADVVIGGEEFISLAKQELFSD